MSRKPTIREIAAEIGRGGRSDLYLWMWNNFDDLRKSGIDRYGGWSRAIVYLTQLGYKSKDGSVLKLRNVRTMFKRVTADKVSAKANPKTPIPQRTPDARSPSAGFEHDPIADEDAIRKLFGG